MAARAGPRAEGTDGSDFKHREKVASHYQESVTIKGKLRKSLVPHMFLTILAFGRLASVALGSTYFKPAEFWELLWIVSGLAAYIGYNSLSKNHVVQILTYIFGNLLFGLASLAYGSWKIIDRALQIYKQGSSFTEWKDAPMKIALIAVCLQVQISGLYNAVRLYKAWTGKGKKE
ncbi:protein jagunal homolog 1-A-like [Rhopilema esculentum]|uniref:protein jagunal homolog 1-A-like n=1 Tax=Rhopilema esculentum TaxID=499914 RepID=UPI0031D9EDD2